MILVDQITEQELDRRFDSLSIKLRDALTSERNLNIVSDICEKNKILDKEKAAAIHQIIGLTILGFAHYYDIGKEINESLSLNNSKFSNDIAEEINAKIFSPIKDDLENNYHPIISEVAKTLTPAKILQPEEKKLPKILTEIATPQAIKPAPIPISIPIPTPTPPPKPAGVPVPMPSVLSQSAGASAKVGIAQVTPDRLKPAAPPPPGWSKARSGEPVVKLSGPVMPAPPVPPGSLNKMPSGPAVTVSITPPTAPAAPKMPTASSAPIAKPSEPAPILIHEDASLRPQQKIPDFHFPITPDTTKKESTAPPLKPAILELGKNAPSGMANTAALKPSTVASTRVVHYTEYKSPTPETPIKPVAPQGPRQVTELTMQKPAPRTMPAAATPPKPPLNPSLPPGPPSPSSSPPVPPGLPPQKK